MTTVNGVTAMEIDFRETGSPTVIRTSDGRDVASQGTIWVVPSDGTVLRTQLSVSGFGGPRTSSAVDVTFARDARLKLWLPAKMTERHEAPAILARLPNWVTVAPSRCHRHRDLRRLQAIRDVDVNLGQVMRFFFLSNSVSRSSLPHAPGRRPRRSRRPSPPSRAVLRF